MDAAMTYRGLLAECENETRRYVDVERDGAVATVRMNNPERLNSLTPVLCYQLHAALRELADDIEVRVVILTGADPAFSAGGDLGLIQRAGESVRQGGEGTTTAWRWIRQQFGGVARLLSQSDTYFIAAVNGPAAGVGLAFAFASDYLLASERAELVTAFGRIGLIPEVGTNWHLCRRLGYQKAMELFVSGERLTAERALELGLANRVVSHDTLLDEARAWADKVCRLPESVVLMAKAQMRKIADMSWEQAIVMEELAEPNCFTTEAHRKAVAAMLEK